MHHTLWLVLVLALTIACGPADDVDKQGSGRPDRAASDDAVDGEDEGVEPTDPTDPTGPTDPTDPTDPTPQGWSADEVEMLALVNAFRTAGGSCPGGTFAPLPPLAADDALWAAARDHSEDMIARDYFAHDGPDGSSFAGRIVDAGYTGQPYGENIAAGNGPAGTFEQWHQSDGHCRNMTTTSANEIGIGQASGGSYGSYWTQTFGRR